MQVDLVRNEPDNREEYNLGKKDEKQTENENNHKTIMLSNLSQIDWLAIVANG